MNENTNCTVRMYVYSNCILIVKNVLYSFKPPRSTSSSDQRTVKKSCNGLLCNDRNKR